MDESPEVIRSAIELLDVMQAQSKAKEFELPHSIVLHDPETDRWETFGPWPTGSEALTALETLRERHLREDPEFANVEYRIALAYPATEVS